MMTQNKFSTLLILVVACIASAFAWGAYSVPLLVLDMRNNASLPKHFRTTSDSLPESLHIDATGLSDLHIAGGAQLSELGLQTILQHLHSQHITIIDLRQESHGFLNGNAVSWYGPHNAANAGKSQKE